MPGHERSEVLARFGELVREHADRVLGLALRLLGDMSAAEDVSQEVFLGVWRVFSRKGRGMNWAGYLRRATIRECVRLVRAGRHPSVEAPDSVADTRSSTPDEEASLRELEGKLRECLSRLPEKQAAAFVLAKVEGLSYRQCADMLGCSEEAARVHAHRAMNRLAEMLGTFAPPAGIERCPR